MATVAAEHGLPPAPLPHLIELPRDELLAAAIEVVLRDTAPAAIETQSRLLTALELVPPDFDWRTAVARALSSGLRAFHDGQRRSIFVDRELSPRLRQRALTHELAHALQNTHFVARRPSGSAPNWDAESAWHTLLEGDAEFLVDAVMGERREAAGSAPARPDPSHVGVPSVLLRALAAPYSDGRAAVEQAHAGGGWEAVNTLLRSPPSSTRELLHPGAPRLPGSEELLPSSPWQTGGLDSRGVIGEQGLRCVLEEWVSAPAAQELASTWRADGVAWFSRQAQSAIVWQLRLDGAASRRGVEAAFEHGLQMLQHAETAAPRFSCRAHRDLGVIALESQAEQLWVLGVHGLSTEAGCRAVSRWAAHLAAGGCDACDPGPPRLTGPD